MFHTRKPRWTTVELPTDLFPDEKSSRNALSSEFGQSL